jgi:DNA G:T-mismatch repair endonuclease
MTDILTKAQRSANMAKIRSAGNASTELRLVSMFRALGVTGWRRGAVIRITAPPSTKPLRAFATSRKSPARVAGQWAGSAAFVPAPTPLRVRPDFVFPKLRIAVFVDGCFWHGCPLHATRPKQNAQFWREKIAANRARDRLVTRRLRARGWRVLRIWEHELTKRHERRLLARLARIGLLNLASGTKRNPAERVAPSPARPRKPRSRRKG